MPKPSTRRAGRRVPLLMRPWVWLKRFFVRPVHLVRDGGHLRVVFEETRVDDSRLPGGAPGNAGAPPPTMHAELRALLDQHAGTRQLMRHLAFIERALQLDGADALDRLPGGVAATGLAQLERLVADWAKAPGLARLRVRLLAAVEASRKPQDFEPTNSKMSDFNAPERVQVSEGTPSTFEELQRIWIEHRPDLKDAVAKG